MKDSKVFKPYDVLKGIHKIRFMKDIWEAIEDYNIKCELCDKESTKAGLCDQCYREEERVSENLYWGRNSKEKK